jgi:adenylate cyclase
LPRTNHFARRHWLAVFFAAGATVLALVFDATTRWPTVLGLAVHDAQVRLLRAWRPITIDSVVLIGIDQATVDAIDLPLTLWHRELGRTLEAVAAARPRLVVLDVVLPERSFDAIVPGLDRALLRGIVLAREAGGIVLALQPDAAGRLRSIYPPFIAAAGNDGVGAAVYPVDADGVVRRFEPRISTFVTAIARKLGQPHPAGLVDYTRGARFEYVPLIDVLRWQEKGLANELALRFAGKTVVVGSVLPLIDRRAQPVSMAAWETWWVEPPGVLIHAQAVRSLLTRGLVGIAAWPGSAALAFILALIGASGHVTLRWILLAGGVALAFAGTTVALDRGVFITLGPALLAGLLAAAARSGFDGWRYLVDRNRVARTFAGYVSPQVFDAVLEGKVLTRGHGRLAFLFADVRGFTTLTQSTPAHEVLDWLNAYYAAVTPILHAHDATIDSFRGDGVTALFGAPLPAADAPMHALNAARAMLTAVDTLNAGRNGAATPPVQIGIGLAYGDAVFGDLGSPDRRDFTAIGDDVNLAARLQDLTKQLACPILLTDAMRRALPAAEQQSLEDFGEQPIKGHTPVRVWGCRPRP